MQPKTLVAMAAASVLATVGVGVAYAASVDNMVPTDSYNRYCIDDSISGTGPVCRTDNATLTIWFQSTVGATPESRTRASLDGSYNGTDLNVSYAAAPSYDGTSETDIIYQVSTSGISGSTIGSTWCDDAAGGYECDQQYVRFKSNAVVDRELACHETGHAVGLLHGAQAYPVASNSNGSLLGCMETPDSGVYPYLGTNNVDNINSIY